MITELIKKKGLKRDKANYVGVMIRLRGSLGELEKMNHDALVQSEIDEINLWIEQSISRMYEGE